MNPPYKKEFSIPRQTLVIVFQDFMDKMENMEIAYLAMKLAKNAHLQHFVLYVPMTECFLNSLQLYKVAFVIRVKYYSKIHKVIAKKQPSQLNYQTITLQHEQIQYTSPFYSVRMQNHT